jgi:hypothetical protein
MSIAFIANYSFSVERDILVDSETLLITDFMNLNIKISSVFHICIYGRIYVYVFLSLNDYR